MSCLLLAHLMGQSWDCKDLEAKGEYATLSTLTALMIFRKKSTAKECTHVWIDRISSSIIWVNADTVETIAKDSNRSLNYLGADSKSLPSDDLLESKHCHEQHGWQDDLLAIHPLVHEWIQVRLLRDAKRERLRDEMVALSSALALHQVRLGEEGKDRRRKEKSQDPQVRRTESITHTKEALVDMKNIDVETVLLASADITCRQRISASAEKQLLSATVPRFAGIAHSVNDTGDSQSHDEAHDAPTMLTAMVYETWGPLWAGLYNSWFIVGNLVIDFMITGTYTILGFLLSTFVVCEL